MKTVIQKKMARELKELVGENPSPKVMEMLHHLEVTENVARELVTALEPETSAALAALADVMDAQLELILGLLRELKS